MRRLKTIGLAVAFAVTSSLAFAEAGGSDAGHSGGQMTKHGLKKHQRQSESARQSGPALEPGAPDASRPGGKGVNTKGPQP